MTEQQGSLLAQNSSIHNPKQAGAFPFRTANTL